MSLLTLVFTVFISACFHAAHTNGFGSPYPVTTAWFKDRYTAHEWNGTLSVFAQQGGDTLMFRAPPVVLMSKDEFLVDPEFQWCGDYRTPSAGVGNSCYESAEKELSALGLHIVTFAKYANEEDFESSAVIRCPQYDKKIVTSRIYYRLVLPYDLNNSCDLNGTDVVVLFTVFSGVDPHQIVIQSAGNHNMSVYFGLPRAPKDVNGGIEISTINPYLDFLHRVILHHNSKYYYNEDSLGYGHISHGVVMSTGFKSKTSKRLLSNSALKGYYIADEFLLIDVKKNDSVWINLFTKVSKITRDADKLLIVGTYFQTNKNEATSSLSDYMSAFYALAESRSVDVISVKDGRGSGRGGYFWPTQHTTPIQSADPGLDKLLHFQYPNLKPNITYSDVFWTSIQQMFLSLGFARDSIAEKGYPVDMWLNIEAFDFLHDDPCLPVDSAASGVEEMLNPVSKSRMDWALTATGPTVQKVASSAWDPSFTCRTKRHKASLTQQIRKDLHRPIIANCSFHSASNRSVVVIGYNLDGETQAFTVDWPGNDGKRHVSNVYGYYFEIDWGSHHHRLPSLMYTQMYDPYDISSLRSHGYVTVVAAGAYHACMFTYDFRSTLDTRRHMQVYSMFRLFKARKVI